MEENTTQDNQSRWEKLSAKIAPIYEKWVAFKTARPKTAWASLIGGSLFLFGGLFILTFYSLIRFEALGHLPATHELRAIENHIASEAVSYTHLTLPTKA